MTLLSDKVILITGAASGIGRAAALEFALDGAVLMLCDRDAAGLAATRAMLAGPAHTTMVADVTDKAAMATLTDRCLAEFGRLDGALNNAGIEGNGGKLTPAVDYDDEQFERVVDVNLRGMWICLRLQARAMLAQGHGAIVNIASVAGHTAAPGQAAYAATKHGVMGLTRAMAVELAGGGVRVNAVAPGITETPMILERGLVQNPGLKEMALAAIPMHRFATARDIAQAAAWLLSDRSAYVTGQVIAVDGGLTTR